MDLAEKVMKVWVKKWWLSSHQEMRKVQPWKDPSWEDQNIVQEEMRVKRQGTSIADRRKGQEDKVWSWPRICKAGSGVFTPFYSLPTLVLPVPQLGSSELVNCGGQGYLVWFFCLMEICIFSVTITIGTCSHLICVGKNTPPFTLTS